MKLVHKDNHIYLEAKCTKVEDCINVDLITDVDLKDHKTYYNINKSTYKEFDKTFVLDKKYFNKKIVVGLKLMNKQTRETKILHTDPTSINLYKSTTEPFNMEMPETFKTALKEVKQAEEACKDVAQQLEEKLKQLETKFDKLGRAVVELGKKGELL